MIGYFLRRIAVLRHAKACQTVFLCGALVLAGSSVAFSSKDIIAFEGSHEQSSTQFSKASSTVAPKCLSLLKPERVKPTHSATDRSQRSAGKLAAVGLVFGVRYALSPPGRALPARKTKLNDLKDMAMSEDRSALHIAAFRSCQKQQSLALSHGRH